jgi:hypothetical protein
MDVAVIAELLADIVLNIFEAHEWSNPAEHPSNLTRGQFHYFATVICSSQVLFADLYKRVTQLVEGVFFKQFFDSGSPGPR